MSEDTRQIYCIDTLVGTYDVSALSKSACVPEDRGFFIRKNGTLWLFGNSREKTFDGGEPRQFFAWLALDKSFRWYDNREEIIDMEKNRSIRLSCLDAIDRAYILRYIKSVPPKEP